MVRLVVLNNILETLSNKYNILFLIISCCTVLNAQQLSSDNGIDFPDIEGHLTLVSDFHSHTVFSDADVWPTIRVEEANKEQLDVLAITDHLYKDPNYSGNGADIPNPDKNRSYDIAESAVKTELVVVHGIELSRSMPLGHCNAIFIKNANALVIEDPVELFEEAKKQNAFTFWNHPYRKQEPYGLLELKNIHKELIDKGLLHGIEVVNRGKFSDGALQIALDNNLTILGNSDIHGFIDWEYDVPLGGHRPVTLVFAKKRNQKSIKKALFNRQTVVWHKNSLIGREEWLIPLIHASLEIESFSYKYDESSYKKDLAYVEIKNNSDAKFILKNTGNYSFFMDIDVIEIPPHETVELEVITRERLKKFNLEFEVLNAIFAPRKHPTIIMEVKR
jgi:3',5'-nucleoside bisphosphate phosphatase